jgi:hypothetical protein
MSASWRDVLSLIDAAFAGTRRDKITCDAKPARARCHIARIELID